MCLFEPLSKFDPEWDITGAPVCLRCGGGGGGGGGSSCSCVRGFHAISQSGLRVIEPHGFLVGSGDPAP